MQMMQREQQPAQDLPQKPEELRQPEPLQLRDPQCRNEDKEPEVVLVPSSAAELEKVARKRFMTKPIHNEARTVEKLTQESLDASQSENDEQQALRQLQQLRQDMYGKSDGRCSVGEAMGASALGADLRSTGLLPTKRLDGVPRKRLVDAADSIAPSMGGAALYCSGTACLLGPDALRRKGRGGGLPLRKVATPCTSSSMKTRGQGGAIGRDKIDWPPRPPDEYISPLPVDAYLAAASFDAF
jgi:hypothetical protein